ncbi:MAG: HAMP domain-containing protein, partial [Spirochaetes bacterium]|nr:HAMP domain-containing protein [Spirochaetota bacterium]
MLKSLLSFRFRISAAIFLVATAGVVLGLTTYYHRVSEQVRNQMTNRVRDFGKIGVSLFTPDDIRYLENLDNRLASPHGVVDAEKNIGVPLSALSEDEKTAILRTNEFQRIVQKLRRIRRASGDKIITEETLATASESLPIHRTWIAGVGMHHAVSDYLRVLCADEFQEVDRNKNQRIDAEEKVFQVGDIFNAHGLLGLTRALNGEAAVTSGYRSEDSGVFIAGYTPIRNARGAIIALLVVDYSAATEFDTLFNLKIVGYYIVIAALIVSIFIAAIVSHFLIAPIEAMQAAAARIGQRDFAIRLKSQTNDELSELADAINLMAQELGEYSTHIEARIDIRTREISSILAALQQGLLTVDAHGVIEAEYS